MSEKSGNVPPKHMQKSNGSNTTRGIIFAVLVICLCMLFVSNMNGSSAEKIEVPISEVIARANDPNGNIKKITVTGESLEITLKGNETPTETSRKDASGTLYDQGLINHCAELAGDELIECKKLYNHRIQRRRRRDGYHL